MLRTPMTRRLLAPILSLVLLLAQQLGALHLLSHVLQPAAHTAVVAQADGAQAAQADAGDALCQVCLVLATLAAASLPAVWGMRVRQATAAAPRLPCLPAPACPAPAPSRARGPPALPALN